MVAEIAPSHIPNLGSIKSQIRAYYGDRLDDAGRHQCSFSSPWGQEVAQVIGAATQFLHERLAAGIVRPAIVLDVDDTAVTTYPVLANNGFGRRQNREVLPAIPPVRDLAHEAERQGVATFYVSLRLEDRRADTLANLDHEGFPSPEGLLLQSEPTAFGTAAKVKAGVRAELQSRGWHIVATIGDQESDVAGGFADAGFKLPNPMYHTA